MNKYHSSKARCLSDHIHDSKKEAQRCNELTMLLRLGKIENLEIQKRYTLIPARKYNGMPSERKCEYVADFVYSEGDKLIVEDTKGYKTKDYIIKRKLFKDRYCQNGDIIFREV